MAFFASTILSVIAYRFVPVYFTPLMFIRCGQQMAAGETLKLRHHWVSLEKISPLLPVAVMASEDQRFLEHHGFDFKAIEHAARRNMEHPEKRRLGAAPSVSRQPRTSFCGLGVRGFAKDSRLTLLCSLNFSGPSSALWRSI